MTEASARGSSFYAAMRLLPKPRREAMYAIYGFCREVDDIADGDAPAEDKRRALADWRNEIDALYDGRPTHPVAAALVEPLRNFGFAKKDFIGVIEGMEMDAVADIVAPDLATLDLYCDRVASAVGRLSVRAFGASGPEADSVAYSLGRALQLSNILRDVREDAQRGRLYLPAEYLDAHGIATRDLAAILGHPGLDGVGRDLSVLAYRHYDDAARAMKACPYAAMRPARIMGAVYRRILDLLVARGWHDIDRPVKVPTAIKLWIMLRYGFL